MASRKKSLAEMEERHKSDGDQVTLAGCPLSDTERTSCTRNQP